jgi:hypothetical protein
MYAALLSPKFVCCLCVNSAPNYIVEQGTYNLELSSELCTSRVTCTLCGCSTLEPAHTTLTDTVPVQPMTCPVLNASSKKSVFTGGRLKPIWIYYVASHTHKGQPGNETTEQFNR